jgi:antirestriction protein
MPEIIDSRDLLKELRDTLSDPHYDYSDEPDPEVWAELDEQEQERVQALRDVLAELPESTVDSEHGHSWGCTLIPEDQFEAYAQEFAEDIGAIKDDAQWPATCIDWEKAARELAMDYTSVELDGTTYLCR